MGNALWLIVGVMVGGYLAFLIAALSTLKDVEKTSMFGEKKENIRDYIKDY